MSWCLCNCLISISDSGLLSAFIYLNLFSEFGVWLKLLELKSESELKYSKSVFRLGFSSLFDIYRLLRIFCLRGLDGAGGPSFKGLYSPKIPEPLPDSLLENIEVIVSILSDYLMGDYFL